MRGVQRPRLHRRSLEAEPAQRGLFYARTILYAGRLDASPTEAVATRRHIDTHLAIVSALRRLRKQILPIFSACCRQADRSEVGDRWSKRCAAPPKKKQWEPHF